MTLLGRLAAGCVIAVLVAGCGDRDGGTVADPPPGPLEIGTPHAWAVTVTSGKTFTDGMELLLLRGRRPATFEDVTVVGGNASLTYLGARIALPSREMTSIQEMKDFPPTALPPSQLAAAEGFTIQPTGRTARRQGYELLVGYRVDDPTFSVRHTIRIQYRIDGQTYLTDIPAGLVTCPTSQDQVGCLRRAGY